MRAASNGNSKSTSSSAEKGCTERLLHYAKSGGGGRRLKWRRGQSCEYMKFRRHFFVINYEQEGLWLQIELKILRFWEHSSTFSSSRSSRLATFIFNGLKFILECHKSGPSPGPAHYFTLSPRMFPIISFFFTKKEPLV